MRALLAALVMVVISFEAVAAEKSILVYLPDAPAESAKKLAECATDLGAALSEGSGIRIEVKLFRRLEDAAAYWSSSSAEVVVLFTPADFLASLPLEGGPGPLYQMSEAGSGTYRRVAVVPEAGSARSLGDLRGKTLSLVLPAGERGRSFTEEVVLGGNLRFDSLASVDAAADDLTAVANVLTGKADAAIVSELNPLLARHLNDGLRRIYTSPPLPTPLLRIRSKTLTRSERVSLEKVIEGAAIQKALSPIRGDDFRRLTEGKTVASLFESPAPAAAPKEFEIARGQSDQLRPRPVAGAVGGAVGLAFPATTEPIEIPWDHLDAEFAERLIQDALSR